MATNPRVLEAVTSEELLAAAQRAVYEYLTGDHDDVNKARVGQATMATLSRRQSADNARDALYFQMARALSSDAAELARYIRLTQPQESPMRRALGEGDGKG